MKRYQILKIESGYFWIKVEEKLIKIQFGDIGFDPKYQWAKNGWIPLFFGFYDIKSFQNYSNHEEINLDENNKIKSFSFKVSKENKDGKNVYLSKNFQFYDKKHYNLKICENSKIGEYILVNFPKICYESTIYKNEEGNEYLIPKGPSS